MAEAINVVVLLEELYKIIKAQKETNDNLAESCKKLQNDLTVSSKETYGLNQKVATFNNLISNIENVFENESYPDTDKKLEKIKDYLEDFKDYN